MPFIVQRDIGAPGDATATIGVTRSGAFVVHRKQLLRIGRGTSAELHFRDAAIALEHAEIREEEAGYRLLDRESITGTYLNGRRIRAEPLEDGDEIEIGPYLLRVVLAGPKDPLLLQIQEIAPAEEDEEAEQPEEATEAPAAEVSVAAPEAAPGAQAQTPTTVGPAPPRTPTPARTPKAPPKERLAAPKVDYAAAYTLRRGVLNKAFLGLALTAAAVLAMAALPLLRRTDAYQPGPISQTHEDAIERAGGLGANNCSVCHDPWNGVPQSACLECHEGEEQHHPRQASSPACTSCHFEHRGRALTAVRNHACVECHGALEVSGAEPPAVAASIQGIAAGHPDFHGPESDPGTLRFDHAQHLRPGLRKQDERVDLECSSCHMPVAAGVDLAEVSFETHCQDCHLLTFDNRYPEERARHGEPKDVEAGLQLFYANLRGQGSVLSRPRGGFGRSVVDEVRIAAKALYQPECAKCHAIDLAARPYPLVSPLDQPERWFSAADFLHGPHLSANQNLSCEGCHAAARTSRAAADVLMPGLENCTTASCHDGRERTRRAQGEVGLSDCVRCHGYHQGVQGTSPEPDPSVSG